MEACESQAALQEDLCASLRRLTGSKKSTINHFALLEAGPKAQGPRLKTLTIGQARTHSQTWWNSHPSYGYNTAE